LRSFWHLEVGLMNSLSGSDQCCYRTFDLMIKDVALAKFFPEVRLVLLV
jgi:hypothetical protein